MHKLIDESNKEKPKYKNEEDHLYPDVGASEEVTRHREYNQFTKMKWREKVTKYLPKKDRKNKIENGGRKTYLRTNRGRNKRNITKEKQMQEEPWKKERGDGEWTGVYLKNTI